MWNCSHPGWSGSPARPIYHKDPLIPCPVFNQPHGNLQTQPEPGGDKVPGGESWYTQPGGIQEYYRGTEQSACSA